MRLGRIVLVLGATVVAAASCFDNGGGSPDAAGDPFVGPDAAADAAVQCNGGFYIVPCICTPGETLYCGDRSCNNPTLTCPETGIDVEQLGDCECPPIDSGKPIDSGMLDSGDDAFADAPLDAPSDVAIDAADE